MSQNRKRREKMDEVNAILQQAVEARETGSVSQAIQLFKEATKIEKDPNKRVDICNHLGLAYWHNNDPKKAKETWKKALVISNVSRNLSGKAVALRNLSRKNLWTTNEELVKALFNATEAFLIAKRLDRGDVVWFIHGVFSAYQALDQRYLLKSTVRLERKELSRVWWKTPKIQRRVWLSGLLMDYVVAYGKTTKFLLRISKFVVRIFKLKRREEQINKLLTSM